MRLIFAIAFIILSASATLAEAPTCRGTQMPSAQEVAGTAERHPWLSTEEAEVVARATRLAFFLAGIAEEAEGEERELFVRALEVNFLLGGLILEATHVRSEMEAEIEAGLDRPSQELADRARGVGFRYEEAQIEWSMLSIDILTQLMGALEEAEGFDDSLAAFDAVMCAMRAFLGGAETLDPGTTAVLQGGVARY